MGLTGSAFSDATSPPAKCLIHARFTQPLSVPLPGAVCRRKPTGDTSGVGTRPSQVMSASSSLSRPGCRGVDASSKVSLAPRLPMARPMRL